MQTSKRQALVMRAFLFSDLRGYTAYVEKCDRAGAELLGTYRNIVRAAIATYEGAEPSRPGSTSGRACPAEVPSLDSRHAGGAEARDRLVRGHRRLHDDGGRA